MMISTGHKIVQLPLLGLLWMLISMLALTSQAHGRDYQLGQGLQWHQLDVSGYATLKASARHHRNASLAVDDFSMMVNGHFNRYFNPFFEGEFAEVPILVDRHRLFTGKKTRILLERLYNDVALSDEWTLRLGKSLTTIGEWNVIHAGPLVETTSRPLTSYRSFSTFTTGLSVLYSTPSDSTPNVVLYWQPSTDLGMNILTIPQRAFRNITGVNIAWQWGMSNNTLGFSVQHASIEKSAERQTLIGMDFHLEKGDFEVQSEITQTWLNHPRPSRQHRQEFGGYLQGEAHLSPTWDLIGRYELFRDRDFIRTSFNATAAVAYHPSIPVVWKLEYLQQWGQLLNLPSGVRGSVSVLF